MSDLISRQAAIDVVSYSIELCNKALDSITLGGRDRYAVEVERNSLLKLKDDIKLLPSAQPEVLACGEGELIAQPEILTDGTLVIDVPDLDKVHRVIVGNGRWCKIFYLDDDSERRTDG